jgi:hypothetical protein
MVPINKKEDMIRGESGETQTDVSEVITSELGIGLIFLHFFKAFLSSPIFFFFFLVLGLKPRILHVRQVIYH